MADITTELNMIANDSKGSNVKQAIHDALEKVNDDTVVYDISPDVISQKTIID